MKVRNTITFIISKNYGPSLSLSLPLWLVYLAGLAMMGMVVSLAGLSLMYLLSIPRIQQLELETRKLKEEVEILRDQLLSASQKAFDRKRVVFSKKGPKFPRVATITPVRGTMKIPNSGMAPSRQARAVFSSSLTQGFSS